MKSFLRVIGSANCDWKSLAEGRVSDAIFCDYGGDVTRGGYVEGDVGGADVWGGADAGGVGDFRRGALFDGDLVAGR